MDAFGFAISALSQIYGGELIRKQGVALGLFLAMEVCKGSAFAQSKITKYFGAARRAHGLRGRKVAVLIADLQ